MKRKGRKSGNKLQEKRLLRGRPLDISVSYSEIKTNGHSDGETRLVLESLVFPELKNEMVSIERKAGKKPRLPKGLPKGKWTEQSLKVLKERYLLKNNNGKVVETADEMCWRVAWNIASAETQWGGKRSDVIKSAKEFYDLLSTHEFLPNSPTLMNAGTGNGLQYSACFVLPVEDSLVGIFDAIKYQALIHQTGGGTGFSFSRLRPKGSVVKSSKGTASGPVSFMRIFDAATNEIKQGGKRRGANMGILRVDHPDVLEFIHCKEEGGITNFNISVAVTDMFMKAYEEDGNYDLVDPKTKKVTGKLNARRVFDEIAEGAWRTGDPGIIFIDRINESFANPIPSLGPVESTNPCGEQPLYPYDSCNLGSIFLNYFVKETSDGVKSFNWERLKEVVKTSTRFLDDVIEMNPYPLEDIRRTSLAIRRIGLGVGGWADLLVELGIAYDSQEALDLGEKIMKVIQKGSVKESQELARERGPFPMWGVSIYKDGAPRRNSTVTTIAPTGTISIIAGSSSGIEPLFAIAYQHIVKDKHLDRILTFFNPKFEEVAKERGFWDEEIRKKVAEQGVVRGIKEIPEDIRRIFGTAHEIHHDWHIKMQSTFQKYTENAVSKTINMKNSVTVDEIKDSYLLAWRIGCKGITVFRDGCKDAQVLNLGVNNKKREKKVVLTEPTEERPFEVHGSTYRLHTPMGTAFITINQNAKKEPIELFVNVGKAGSDVTAMAEALGRTISTALRFHGEVDRTEKAKEIAEQLAGIGGRRSVGFGPKKILSLPDAIAAAISMHLGLRVNGFVPKSEFAGTGKLDTVAKDSENNLHLNGNGNGTASDEAGAVMSAHISAQQSPLYASDDHTTASTASEAASNLDHVDQLVLEDTLLLSHKHADICPSCGANSFVYQEGCAKCYACGFSEC
jgi:ribonucleoside-diphosphate reductase alpha chain